MVLRKGENATPITKLAFFRKGAKKGILSEPVLTQLRLTPDNSDPVPTRYVPPRSRSPLVLVSHFVSVPVVLHLGLCSI